MAGWAQAVGAGTSLLGSIIGGSQARGAVKRAGTVLKTAAEGETDRIYQKLMETTPQLADAYLQARQSVTSTADYTGEGLQQAAERAHTMLTPYTQAGGGAAPTLADLVNAPEERFAFQFSQDDPSYQFRLGEGQKALERSAAARGTLLGGGTLKAITNYGQQAASQEYQNAYARAMDAFKANQTGRQQRMTTLADLARLGGTSAASAGQLGLEGATSAGRLRTGAAQTARGWGVASASRQVDISNKYGDTARNLALARAQATAGSQLGTGNIWANFWNQTGQNMGDWLHTKPSSGQQGGGQGAPGGGMGSWNWGSPNPSPVYDPWRDVQES